MATATFTGSVVNERSHLADRGDQALAARDRERLRILAVAIAGRGRPLPRRGRSGADTALGAAQLVALALTRPQMPWRGPS